MIPKVVHYFWLGGNKKSELTNICINSWREKLEGYEIIEWNEENLDLEEICNGNKFFRECMKRDLWAFMVDYLRLKILYEHGGIYMDTDVQVVKDFSILLNNKAFIGMEAGDFIGTGVIACESGNKDIKRVLDYYTSEIWETNLYTIPHIITHIFKDVQNDSFKIYPMEYFAPYDYNKEFNYSQITDNTYSVHWYNGSWTNNLKKNIFMSTKHIDNDIKKIIIAIRKVAGYYFNKVFRNRLMR